VPQTRGGTATSLEFETALASVRRARPRRELAVSDIPAPGGLAPGAVALAADIPSGQGDGADLGTGRFILLHDPSAPEAWGGRFRVVCFVQAPLEPEIGRDPLLAGVAWSWLVDSLASRGARYHSLSGTATTILSTGYGELSDHGDGAQIELRASWTPRDLEIASHVEGWGELLCKLAGLPPTIEGVTVLAAHRAGRE
jgi:hypothetical protein